jgi:hydroxymethylglutaryl-CoA lyase
MADSSANFLKIIECPRDAMQGLHDFIPTIKKAEYLQQLLSVGFDTLDFGSFVSPKAIPQMRDTAQVLSLLDLSKTKTKLLAIVANERGANDACQHSEITYLGYPFSISETFQIRNANSNIEKSLSRLSNIKEIGEKANKDMVVYISMGFGNPYGDEWNVEIVQKWVEVLADLGVKIIQLSDTVGVAKPESISYLFNDLIPANPEIEIGAHFHTTPYTWLEKVESAYENGCRRFDGTIKGVGGCPMAQNDLVGNMPSEHLITFAKDRKLTTELDYDCYAKAMKIAMKIM